MEITLNVKGMHCASCETLITDDLLELGVSKVKADHKTATVTINFDEKKTSLLKIKKVISDLGYKP